MEEPNANLRDGEEMWCAGLPLTTRRLLTSIEREDLARTFQRGKFRSTFGCLLTPVLFLIWLMSLTMISDTRPGGEVTPVTSSLMIGGIIALAVFALNGYTDKRNRRGFSGDLKEGYVLHFEGKLLPEPFDKTQQALLKNYNTREIGLITEPESIQSLEILPISKRVWRVNDDPALSSEIVGDMLTVASTPAFAQLAQDWLEPVPNTEPEMQMTAGSRVLSAAEQEELRRIAAKLWKPHVIPFCLLTLWAGGLLLFSLFEQRLPPETVRFLVLLLFAWFYGIFFVQAVMQARLLQRDEKEERLMIVRQRVKQELLSEEKRGLTDTEFIVYEVLPYSRRVWTQNGKPAQWRTTASL